MSQTRCLSPCQRQILEDVVAGERAEAVSAQRRELSETRALSIASVLYGHGPNRQHDTIARSGGHVDGSSS